MAEAGKNIGQGSYKKGHKNVAYLQKCKNEGKKLVQHCPSTGSYHFTMAAEMSDVDICRLISHRWSPSNTDMDAYVEDAAYTLKHHRNYAPNIHINYMMETPVYINKERAVAEGAKLISVGASSFLCMGIANETVKFMADNYVPTFCHVGGISGWQTNFVGGYKKLGKTAEDALRVFKWAYEYQENGMSAMTVELVPGEVTSTIAKKLRIPVLGIAAGTTGGAIDCDGYEMVDGDLFGTNPYPASHAMKYGDLMEFMCGVYSAWVNDVRSNNYPQEQHGWHMDPDELEKFLTAVENF